MNKPGRSWMDHAFRSLEWGLAALLLAMVVLVFGNVVLRYAFNTGIGVSEELSRWMFVWLIFLGALVGLKERGHLGTDMLVSRLGRRARRVCLASGQLLMIGASGLLAVGGLAQARINWDVDAPVSGLSMAVLDSAGVCFGIAATALLLRELWRTLAGSLHDDDLTMVQDGEDLAPLRHTEAQR